MDVGDILPLAQGILNEAVALVTQLGNPPKIKHSDGSPRPNKLWDHPPPESNLAQSQAKLLGLLQKLSRAVRGPQDYLQELVASNWEQGSLYCLLDNGVLEHIPNDRSISVADLAAESSIPEDKLLSMLRLAACDHIIEKGEGETFRHGLMSRELVNDPSFKAFIEFQLYETRVASAHLANSVKTANPTWTGQSAFEYAWGKSMEEWHSNHPEKGIRFTTAMQKVIFTLDPGNKLLEAWFKKRIRGSEPSGIRGVVEFTWSGGISAQSLLQEEYPYLKFSAEKPSPVMVEYNQTRAASHYEASVYLLKSALWCCPDQDCIKVLRDLSRFVALNGRSLILFNDFVSPEPGAFEPHVEKAYRRRDVTVMTMHNARLRTATEWMSIFRQANPDFIIKLDGVGFTSHSYRGQWELKLP